MRKCSKCGKTYDDSWKICIHCNIDLLNVSSNDVSIPEIVASDVEKYSERNTLKGIRKGTGCAIAGIGYLALSILGLVIHIWTIIIAYSFAGILGAAISLMLPMLSQIFWGFKMWNYTGTIMNNYCMSLIGYVVAFIVVIIGAGMSQE